MQGEEVSQWRCVQKMLVSGHMTFTHERYVTLASFFYKKDPEPCDSVYINKLKRTDPVYM